MPAKNTRVAPIELVTRYIGCTLLAIKHKDKKYSNYIRVMKYFIVLLLPCLALAAPYEDIDDDYIPTLIENKERMKNFLGCIVKKSECDDFGNHIKTHITESLADGCNECDPVQKHYSHIIINIMRKDYPELYNEFEVLYDPDGKLLESLDEHVKKYW